MKAWRIHGFALAAYLAFVTTACESKSGGVTDRRPAATVALIEADGHSGASNGSVSYGADDAASETVYKSETCESNRHDASDNERPDWKLDRKNEPGKKDKSDKKRKSEKGGKLERKDKSHKKGELDKRESGKTGPGSSERSALRNYYFGDDDGEIVMPDETLIGGDDPVTIIKTYNDVARISSSEGTVRAEDGVKEIDVYGSDVDVVVDSTAKVRILGSDANAFVRSVSSVHFDSSDDDVRWIDDPTFFAIGGGTENEIRQTRPVPARQPQTANVHYHQVTTVLVELTYAL